MVSLAACLAFAVCEAKDPDPSMHRPGSVTEKPNIILIVADDLGYGDIGCCGNPVVQTPNLDQLAKDGIRLTQCYSAAPVCGPSRVSLLTGRYSERSGYRMALPPRYRDSSLEEPWIMRQLQENGYVTGAFGKWHIGSMTLRERGFDEWVITAPGGYAEYYDYQVYRNTEEKPQPSDGTYATEFLTDEVLTFIDRHAGEKSEKPFFIYLAYTAPHWPLQAPDEEVAPYRNRGLPKGTEIIYGMVTSMDRNIGRVFDALDEKGLRDNTLIVFTSDNGPEMIPHEGLSRKRMNGGLSGEKAFVLEGGVRVPGIVSWPSKFPRKGVEMDDWLHAVDWGPTILDSAGVKPSGKPFDGASRLGLFTGGTDHPSPARFWCCNYAYFTSLSNAAMREGDWKIHRPRIVSLNRWGSREPDPPVPEPEPWQLFNLEEDPGEKVNLAEKYPERIERMVRQFDLLWEEALDENECLGGPAGP
jgi:arylsulfatase A-like enzyme